MDTTDGGVREHVECGGGEVEGGGDVASTAAVRNSNGNLLALICERPKVRSASVIEKL